MKHLLFALLAATLSIQTAHAKKALTKNDAATISQPIYNEALERYVATFESQWNDSALTTGEYRMPFWYKISGTKPAAGYPMYISMHGGGGTQAKANDKQWENQKRLYGTVDGLYFVPRAPTNTWNLWHQQYMDSLLLKAISYAVCKLEVDPNRIYLTGYSAGGDGTFNLAPRMADRFAAAAMMAGHPADAVAENLRNLPFAIYMGGQDAAYNRNGLAVEWKNKLDSLQKNDPAGFTHHVKIYPECGHWMNNQDREAIPWMASFNRNPYPEKIIWVQDDVTRPTRNWIQVQNPKQGQKIIATYSKDSNTINIEQSHYPQVTLWLNDQMVDLDKPIVITYQGKTIAKKRLPRTHENLVQSATLYMDQAYQFPSKITVTIPAATK